MALKAKYKSKAEIPAELSQLYIERESADESGAKSMVWVLDAEGLVDKARVDEFRQNNTKLQKAMDELTKRFEGVDPDAARAALQKQQQLDDADLVKAGDVTKLVDSRVASVRAEMAKQVSDAQRERDAVNARLHDLQINQGIVSAASKRGVRASALVDVSLRAKSVFRLVNDVPTAFDASGQNVKYAPDGVTPLTLDAWVEGLQAEAPHLFESSAGGGAPGNGSGGAGLNGHGRNPWKRETWNFTEQSKMTKDNPSLAAQLKAAAGR